MRTLGVFCVALLGLQSCVGVAALEIPPPMLGPPDGIGTEGPLPGIERQPHGFHACPVETMSCYPGCASVGGTYACGKALIELAGSLAAAIEAIARSEGMTLEDFCEKHEILCAKGGKKNLDNEYVREAKELPKGVDPCEWLRGVYTEAIACGDTVEGLKIKQAQKAMGCRPNANDF